MGIVVVIQVFWVGAPALQKYIRLNGKSGANNLHNSE